MYDIAEVLPTGTVSKLAPGTNLLLLGPAMTGKNHLALELLAAGHGVGDGLLIITTNRSAGSCIDHLERKVATLDRNLVGVVDCSGRDQQQTIQNVATQRVSSPSDLTGISIGTAKVLEQFSERNVSSVRHGLVSVSTLLQYLDLDTVFKFLHIYTRRIDDIRGIGIFTIDNASHDPQMVNTIASEFDCMIELREGDDDGREMRIRGLPSAPSDWIAFSKCRT